MDIESHKKKRKNILDILRHFEYIRHFKTNVLRFCFSMDLCRHVMYATFIVKRCDVVSVSDRAL